MNRFIFFLIFFFSVQGFATIRILTFYYNQPDFIELQYRSLKKFLKEDFELIVFNDARTIENKQGIDNACKTYGIQCIRFEQEWHLSDPLNTYLRTRLQEPSTIGNWGWNASTSVEQIANHPSVRHCHVIQYALDHFGYDHDDIVVIMDEDNFLIKPLSFRELLGSHDIVGFNQRNDPLGASRKKMQMTLPKGHEMLWVVFIAFCPAKLPNPREMHFNVDVISGWPLLPENTIGDTGAAIYKYLQKYPDLKIQSYYWQDSGIFREYFSHSELKDIGFTDDLIRFIRNISPGNVQFFAFEHFMHFGGVSFEEREHGQKVYYLHKFMSQLLKD